MNVGILDTGVNPKESGLKGRITWFNAYLKNNDQTKNQNQLASANDPIGHGTIVADILGGTQQGTGLNLFVGGVAPGVNLYVAQVCSKTNCFSFPKAYQDMMSHGVHLFNMSYGAMVSTFTGNSLANAEGYAGIIAPYYKSYGTHNVYVWAAGNDPKSTSDISAESLLPLIAPSLQPQWLVAVNVMVSSSGKITGLDPGSSQCGLTAQWCIAAPGAVIFPPELGTKFSGGGGIGTSFSAAIITGVSALIWQAYPWFTPANLTDTILTTATPQGKGPYPNAVYGWGEVNAAKAVNGPAQFAFGSFSADIGGDSSTFSNGIGGKGALVLTGTKGTLTLTGANTYAGGTTVSSGNLWLSGSLASDVTLDGGSFGGAGTVHSWVMNTRGTLISQAAVGGQGLTITGNYTAGSLSTTAIGLGNPLTVDGTASLAGILEILAPPTTYTPHSTETLIQAGTLSGAFAKKTYGAGVYYVVNHLIYGAKKLTVTVTRSNVAQTSAGFVGVTEVALATAQGVQNSLQQVDHWTTAQQTAHAGFLRNVSQFLAARTAIQATTSLASLSGEIYGTARLLEVQQAMDIGQTLAGRVNALNDGLQPGVWIQATGGSGTSRQAGTATARDSLGGVMAGVDVPISDHLAVGMALGRSHLDASLDGLAGRIDGKLDTVAVYGRAELSDDAYVSVRLSDGQLDARVNRTLRLGATLQPVSGHRSDRIRAATLEMGKRLGHWTPYVSLTGVQLHEAGFAEKGASGFGLTAPAQNHSIGYSTLGLRVATRFRWAMGTSDLSAHASWRHALTGARLGFQAAFVGTPTAMFTSQGQNLAQNANQIGVKLATRVDPNWSWFVGFGLTRARGSNVSKIASAGMSFRW